MAMLFNSQGLSEQFHLFNQALGSEIHTHSANKDINQINSFFEQMTSTGLDLPDSFHTMFLLLAFLMISFPSAQQSLKLLLPMTSQLILLPREYSLRLIFTVLDSHCNSTFLMWRMNL